MTNAEQAKQQLREKLDIIFNPIQEDYDGGDPMLPGTIPQAKAEIMHLIDEYVAGLIPEKKSYKEGDSIGVFNGHNHAIDEIRKKAGL